MIQHLKQLWMAAFAAFGMGFAAFAGEWDGVLLQGRTLEDKAFYAPGEKMTFELKPVGAEKITNAAFFVQWTRTGDDGKVEKGLGPVSATQPLVFTTSLEKPGFVRIYAEIADADGKPYRRSNDWPIFFDGGAGVEPEKLQSVPEPADFDAFWTKQKARLVAMPMTVRRKELPSQQGRVYAVEISCPSVRPVTGYLQVPADASPTNRYPCRLDLHGYGYYPNPKAPTGAWHKDALVLSINAHGLRLPEFGADAAYYKALEWEIKSNGHTYGFDPKQNADPETAYFNGMALRVMRALQYLKSLPEWNGKDLIASGGSQGGLQAIWAAALDPDVTRAESTITWCCDMGGTELGRNRGGWYVRWVPALGYYDPVNMARRIPKTCLTVIPRAGLGDYVCPPSGLAVLYNNIPGPKKITWVQGSTHVYEPPQPNQAYTFTANGAE